MRDVAIVSFAQAPNRRRELRNEVEILMPVVQEAVARCGIERPFDFTCSGSSDFLQGQPFAFVMALDAAGAWPPIPESHVEMDGAWALYEAWVKIQAGQAETALVYSFGKSSPGDLPEVLATQLDPYLLAPLWPDSVSLAALQARAWLEKTGRTDRELAEIAARSRRDAKANPNATISGDYEVEKLLATEKHFDPLRAHDCAKVCDGAAAIVLAAGDRARAVCKRPAWIRGIDHRIEPHQLGSRDLTVSVSTKLAGEKAGVGKAKVDVAELHAPFTHQEAIVREALSLGPEVRVNPSGGALCANPMMAAGLIRFGEAASRIMDGSAQRAVAHATSGPCLQQNLVCVLEGE